MSSPESGTRSFKRVVTLLAAMVAAFTAGEAGAVVAKPQAKDLTGARFIAVGSELDWLLYKPNTDYLNFPNREPGYREPGDRPYLPEPLPRPLPRGVKSAEPVEPPGASVPSQRWRKGMLACEVVRRRLAAAGYASVRATDCQGDVYGFTGSRDKARFRIAARARDGEIVSETRLDD